MTSAEFLNSQCIEVAHYLTELHFKADKELYPSTHTLLKSQISTELISSTETTKTIGHPELPKKLELSICSFIL